MQQGLVDQHLCTPLPLCQIHHGSGPSGPIIASLYTQLPQVMPHDERGRRVARQPTLFWMPHCEAALTDALLAANLEAGTLQNVVVLGNRFSGYQASWALPHRAQQQSTGGGGTSGSNAGSSGSRIAQLERPTTMLRLCEQGVAQEQRVSECRFPVASAFNDLGLHWFPPAWRQRLESGMEGLSVS